MTEPTLDELVAMVSDLHRTHAIDAGQAVDILAGLTGLPLVKAAILIREHERRLYAADAERWTPRSDDGRWTP